MEKEETKKAAIYWLLCCLKIVMVLGIFKLGDLGVSGRVGVSFLGLKCQISSKGESLEIIISKEGKAQPEGQE